MILVPALLAGTLGFWAYANLRDASPPNQAQAIVRFPASAFPVGMAERELRSAPELISEDQNSYVLSIEDIPGILQPTYRTLRLTLTSAQLDTSALLQATVDQLARAVSAFDAESQTQVEEIARYRDTLAGYLNVFDSATPSTVDANTVAEASAVAALVDAMQTLETREEGLSLSGRGPLDILQPVLTINVTPSLRWIRFPIVGAIGGLVAVLFMAFTLDGLRIATARRQRHP